MCIRPRGPSSALAGCAQTHAVYKFLRSADLGGATNGEIEWNFAKFVIGRDGQVLKRYGQGVKPPVFEEQLPAWLG